MEWMLMPLKRYAEFSGRSRRMEYWMFQLFMFLVYLVMVVLMMVLGGGALMAGGDPSALAAAGGAVMIIGGLYFLFALAMLIPSLAVAVRRLHDTNRSGWWILAPLAGYAVMAVGGILVATSPDNPGLGGVLATIGLIAALGLALTVLVFMFLEGTRGPNNYGPDPKGDALDKVFA
ncbi:MAG: hypothetical protein QOG72_3334 [Sphingomonadales bacterium]|jgi:uncharacterized membrane protein YhaH (DUF805 family)|nr:hypothetical protein [Sphingomonadales bacterium]